MGTWKNTETDSELEMTMTTTMTFNANNTFEMEVLIDGELFARSNGTWTATADSVTTSTTSCAMVDFFTGTLQEEDDCGEDETAPINISGNKWTMEDEETGEMIEFTRQ